MSAKTKAAKAALDAISGVADDVVRAVAAPKKAKLQALDELAKPVTQAADDWGWKGGKPEELSGTEYIDDIKKYANEFGQLDVDDMIPYQAQLSMSKYPSIRAAAEDEGLMSRVYKGFAAMEKQDMPRKWTGRAMDAVLRSSIPIKPKELSSLMRPMSNSQRETFLALLPEWTQSLDDLAIVAKELG